MTRYLSFLALAVTTPLLAATRTSALQISPQEAAVVRSIDARADEAIAMLERIVNINSGTMNFDGVREVGRVLAAELEGIGFEVELTDGSAFGRAGHLIARNMPADATGPHLLLIGHLDTVFEPGSPFQTFTMTSDTTATGTGVVDKKGGDVVIVEAMRALREAGELADLRISIVMTGDEDASGRPLDL
jgi:glutamate carboxypeptidase